MQGVSKKVRQYARPEREEGEVTATLTLHERGDTLLMLERTRLLDQIDLILEDDDVLELHDLDRGQVLGRLRLRARLVPGDKEERGVHDGRTVKHGGHENVVAGAVDEGDVPDELHLVTAPGPLAGRVVLF
jgi:hypothetical protein